MYQFKQVMGSSKYRPWKEWEAGDYVVGEFLRTQPDNFGHDNVVLDIKDSNIEGIVVGDNFTLNSNGSLKAAMDRGIEEGDVIKVIYKGKDVMTKGKFKGKEFHKLEVMVAGKPEASDTDEDIL